MDGVNFRDQATGGLTRHKSEYTRNDSMEVVNLACILVQYRAFVNSELVNSLTVEKTGNFLIRRLLKTDSYVITHVTRH